MSTATPRWVWFLRARYVAIGLAFATSLVLLQETHVMTALSGGVDSFLDLAARFGAPGMFVAGLLGNASILVQVPYTLPLLSVAIDGASLPHLVVLGVACGVG